MPNIAAHSATRPLAAPAALPTARAAAAQPQLGLGRCLTGASNRCAAAPDRPQTTQGPVPQQARFQSLLFRVANGVVNASPARQDQAVALYGLSHAQIQLGDFVCGELDMQNVATIATYNKQLDIVHYSRDYTMSYFSPRELIQEFSRHISDAAAGKLVKRARQPAAPILQAWADYLGAHHTRLDPFIRLNALLANVPPEERSAVATRFVLKNTSGDCRTETTVNNLLHLVHACGCKNADDVVAALGKLTLDRHDLLDLSELFIKHFFRNSSKLGLEFFAKQGAEIAFAWNDAGRGKMDLEAIRQKPWQEQQRRFQHSYEPITYSEVRSVLRQPELFDGKVSKVYFADDGVELAGSPASEQWVALTRPIAAQRH
ncbi:hypothetical protein [Chromobacterium haemolyticum]|uniref:hypothetical protein n=1 Tax=Chromobacterium haemolyticum TaxID=394935 RepID=UPI002447BF25|nr:hypothetical protein [Chromobacterium haemolyticum]MDH0343785.1 hypothetical protein [Chromobacterium haemolyticum]